MRILLRAGNTPFEIADASLSQTTGRGNSGNLLFAHSVYKSLYTPGNQIDVDGYRPDFASADEINERYDIFVLPLANAVRPAFRGSSEAVHLRSRYGVLRYHASSPQYRRAQAGLDLARIAGVGYRCIGAGTSYRRFSTVRSDDTRRARRDHARLSQAFGIQCRRCHRLSVPVPECGRASRSQENSTTRDGRSDRPQSLTRRPAGNRGTDRQHVPSLSRQRTRCPGGEKQAALGNDGPRLAQRKCRRAHPCSPFCPAAGMDRIYGHPRLFDWHAHPRQYRSTPRGHSGSGHCARIPARSNSRNTTKSHARAYRIARRADSDIAALYEKIDVAPVNASISTGTGFAHYKAFLEANGLHHGFDDPTNAARFEARLAATREA